MALPERVAPPEKLPPPSPAPPRPTSDAEEEDRSRRSIMIGAVVIVAVLLAGLLLLRLKGIFEGWGFLGDEHVREWLLRYRMALLFIAGGLSGVIGFFLIPAHRLEWRPTRAVFLLTFVLLPQLGLFAGIVQRENRWGWILALLPTALIVQHVVFVHLYRRAFRPDGAAPTASPTRAAADFPFLVDMLRSARDQNRRFFDPMILATRFGVPAFLVAVVGVTAFYTLFATEAAPLSIAGAPVNPSLLVAARLGEAGAYCYVMLYLGRRAFRHDITSGGATFCAVMLAAGPALAIALKVFEMKIGSGAGAAEPVKFGESAIYFLAGFSPRQLATWLDEAARRLWTPASTRAGSQVVPLSQLRGITAAIEERLAEEDIGDVHAVAMTDPLKLFRNTNFDKRLILSWIDEGLLVEYVPDGWQALEKEGITGAVDLAWHGMRLSNTGFTVTNPAPQPAGVDPPPQAPATLAPGDAITRLATAAKLSPSALADIAVRMFQDAQVLLVWALYQYLNTTDADLGDDP